METLSADMAGLMSSKKQASSILDVVGVDVNSSFDRAKQIQIVSDTFHISAGGQDVGGNYNIQIQLRDDNAIHYLNKSGLLFDYFGNLHSFPHNAAILFSGLELSIGGVVISTPFQHFFVQQKLTRYGRKKADGISGGLCWKYDDFGSLPSFRDNPAGTTELRLLVPTHNNADPAVVTQIANASSTKLCLLTRQLATHYLEKSEGDGAGQRVKMFVPFSVIFPCLDEIPDHALFTGYGQAIKMNIRTNIPGDCLNFFGIAPAAANAGGVPSYTLKNMQLVKVFSKLDQPRTDLVLKSSIQMPLFKYVHWQQFQSTGVINAIYSVSKDELVKGLWFAFHTKTACARATEADNTEARMITNAAAQYKSPLSYFVQMPIQQIDIHLGGDPIIINAQQLNGLHIIETLADDKYTYKSNALRMSKWAYHISLERFCDDLYGSSAKQTSTIQVQITMKTGAGSRTLNNQDADWDDATIGNFSFYSYLETMSMFELKNGIYSAK